MIEKNGREDNDNDRECGREEIRIICTYLSDGRKINVGRI